MNDKPKTARQWLEGFGACVSEANIQTIMDAEYRRGVADMARIVQMHSDFTHYDAITELEQELAKPHEK